MIELAAVSYAESSVGNGVTIKNEIYGIANAINNYKNIKSSPTYMAAILGTGALAATDGNNQYPIFKNAADNNRNGKAAMQYAIGGALNVIIGGQDYANGGVKWAGVDAGSKSEKWFQGFKFTDASHDIFSLGDNKKTTAVKFKDGKSRGSFDYKWQSTAGYSGTSKGGKTYGTMFIKLTPEASKVGVKY